MSKTLYFICKWAPTPVAWLSIKPYKNGVEIGTVKWRGKPFLVNIIADKEDDLEISTEKERYPAEVYALLKSNLQKQIRRQSILAVGTAARMWELSKFELLRRLVVITAEDVELNIETAIITWLMTARTKGLLLNNKHRDWVLGYVAKLVKYPVCRRLELDKEYSDLEMLEPLEILDGEHYQREQLAAIFFRIAYGGLKCDLPMISHCLDWLIITESSLPKLNVQVWQKPIPKLLINRAAIDHHIWSGLVEEIQKLHSNYSSDTIASAIWNCSSGINKRKAISIDHNLEYCWKDIKEDFSKLTKGYLSRILNKYGKL